MMKTKVNPVKALTPEQDLQSFRRVGAALFAEHQNLNLFYNTQKKTQPLLLINCIAAVFFVN